MMRTVSSPSRSAQVCEAKASRRMAAHTILSIHDAVRLAPLEPATDPLHRLAHVGGGAGVAEADEMVAAGGIEIDAGGGRHMRVLQQALGEIEAVVGEARDVGV